MREREKDERQRPWIPDRVGDDRRRGRTGMTEEKKQILHFVQDDIIEKELGILERKRKRKSRSFTSFRMTERGQAHRPVPTAKEGKDGGEGTRRKATTLDPRSGRG